MNPLQRGAELSLISQPHLLPVGLMGLILHSNTLVSHPHYFTSHLELTNAPSSEHTGPHGKLDFMCSATLDGQ